MNDFLQSLRNGQAEKQRTPKTRKNYDNAYHYTTQRFNSYNSGYSNNRNQGLKRPPMPPIQGGNQLPMEEPSVAALLADALDNLCSHIENLAKSQDYLISVQERTADMLERQAIAIERIVDHVNIASEGMETEDPVEMEKDFHPRHATLSPVESDMPTSSESVAGQAEPEKTVIRRRKKIVPAGTESFFSPKDISSQDSRLLSRDAVMDIIHSMRSQGATFDEVAGRLTEMGQPTFSGRGEWHAQTIHRLCNRK